MVKMFCYVSMLVLACTIRKVFTNSTLTEKSPLLDPKRRSDLVDEAFSEQRDILLDMLESKLKEVKDNKKKAKNGTAAKENTKSVLGFNRCENFPENINLKMKANGINGVGELDVQLKFGDAENNHLKLEATGVSNVGRSQLEIGVAEGNINIPGLSDLFKGYIICSKGKDSIYADGLNPSRKNDANTNSTNTTAALDNVNATVTVTNLNANAVAITANAVPANAVPANAVPANAVSANAVPANAIPGTAAIANALPPVPVAVGTIAPVPVPLAALPVAVPAPPAVVA